MRSSKLQQFWPQSGVLDASLGVGDRLGLLLVVGLAPRRGGRMSEQSSAFLSSKEILSRCSSCSFFACSSLFISTERKKEKTKKKKKKTTTKR